MQHIDNCQWVFQKFQKKYVWGVSSPFSILRHTVPKNLIIPYGIVILSAAIAGIALYGVNCAVLDFLNDTHMVGFSVLRA